MLLKLDDEIEAAYENAAGAAECAKACRLPEERDGWLTLENGYLLLARTLEISLDVRRWVAEAHRRQMLNSARRSTRTGPGRVS